MWIIKKYYINCSKELKKLNKKSSMLAAIIIKIIMEEFAEDITKNMMRLLIRCEYFFLLLNFFEISLI